MHLGLRMERMKNMAGHFLKLSLVVLLIAGCVKYDTYYVKLENTYGLKKYDEILIKGKRVGSVADVDLKDGHIVVEIHIEARYPVYQGVIAEVESVDLFGRKAIELTYSGNNKQTLNNLDTIAGKYKPDTSFNRLAKKIDTLMKAVTDTAVSKE